MDRENKAFKVFVLVCKARWTRGERSSYWESAGVALQMFDSLTGEWTTVCENFSDQLLFGHKKFFREDDSAYDVANRQLLNLSSYDFRIWRRDSFSARHKDRLFVLQMGLDGPANEALAIESPTSYILEFRLQRREGRLYWLKVGTHRCNPFEHPPGKADGEYYMEMYSCNGFLVVMAAFHRGLQQIRPTERLHAHDRFRGRNCSIRFNNQLAWLNDLSTRKWSTLDLPQLPVGQRTYSEDGKVLIVKLPGGLKRSMRYDGDTQTVDLMCELHWTM